MGTLRERQPKLPLRLRGKRYKHDPRAVTWSKPPASKSRPDYTERAAAAFERGKHWITLLPIGPETCGTCGNLRPVARGNKYYLYKCRLRDTRSARTDIRKSWPSCEAWRPRTEEST